MNANRLQLAVGDLICSTTSDYEVQHLLGSGTFGVVTKCKKLATNEMVAVKILKSKRYINEAKKEVQRKLCAFIFSLCNNSKIQYIHIKSL